MKPICRKVQETMAGEGVEALRADLAARRHLGECAECASVLESLAALDEALGTLPLLDAPEATVRSLLVHVEQEERERTPESISGRRVAAWLAAAAAGVARVRPAFRGLAAAAADRIMRVRPAMWGLAGAAAVVAFVGLTVPALYRPRADLPLYSIGREVPEAAGVPARARNDFEEKMAEGEASSDRRAGEPTPDEPLYAARSQITMEEVERTAEEYERQLEARREEGRVAPMSVPTAEHGRLPESYAPKPSGVAGQGLETSSEEQARETWLRRNEELKAARMRDDESVEEIHLFAASPHVRTDVESGEFDLGIEGGVVGGLVEGDVLRDRVGDERADAQRPLRAGAEVAAPKKIEDTAPVYPEAARMAGVEGYVILEVTVGPEGRVTDAKVLRGEPLLREAALAAVRKWRYQPTLLDGRPVAVTMTVTVRFSLSETPKDDRSALPRGGSNAAARAFLAERSSAEGLTFKTPRGYWANSYLPGDPVLRLLQARLAAWDRSALEAAAGVPLRLHDRAVQTAQPFDPPRRGALALYLHGDRRGLEGPGRMLLQVGLQGSTRAGARRPAMNVGVVLDLRGEVPVEVAAGMRALAFAFSQARQAGDRFQLVVAGRPGGVAIAPGDFKHGPLAVTIGRLLEDGGSPEGDTLGLVEAVAAALEAVSRGDDPEAPLGSSAVVLVTGQPLGSSTSELGRLAHQGAVAGIPLSVVGVGPGVPLRDMDRLALAGQGSRRQLESRSEALELVEQELATAARVVARAVRLRIRLAPGVRLVEVVGSRRLDEVHTQRVREAERSIDLRLSRNLGIEADRGEDEDGIKIVIPHLRAGDSHAILLDVVAPGPGPVAEVTARYKDIVELRNGVARASLRIDDSLEAPGPLERNVLKNLLALRLSETLTRAGECLRAGDAAQAATLLEGAHALRSGLGRLRPAFAGDPELGRDLAMLGEYVRLLRGSAAGRPGDRARLADSLRYAGRLKVLPRPAPLAARGA